MIDETPEELAAHSRALRNSVISLAVFFALIVALLLSVPGLHSVEQDIYHADSQWVAAGVGLELLSCASYVVLFGLVFGMLGKRLVSRLSLAELAVNSVVSVSGLAGLALGAWVLRTKGISVARIALAMSACSTLPVKSAYHDSLFSNMASSLPRSASFCAQPRAAAMLPRLASTSIFIS